MSSLLFRCEEGRQADLVRYASLRPHFHIFFDLRVRAHGIHEVLAEAVHLLAVHCHVATFPCRQATGS